MNPDYNPKAEEPANDNKNISTSDTNKKKKKKKGAPSKIPRRLGEITSVFGHGYVVALRSVKTKQFLRCETMGKRHIIDAWGEESTASSHWVVENVGSGRLRLRVAVSTSDYLRIPSPDMLEIGERCDNKYTEFFLTQHGDQQVYSFESSSFPSSFLCIDTNGAGTEPSSANLYSSLAQFIPIVVFRP